LFIQFICLYLCQQNETTMKALDKARLIEKFYNEERRTYELVFNFENEEDTIYIQGYMGGNRQDGYNFSGIKDVFNFEGEIKELSTREEYQEIENFLISNIYIDL
jgi:hypothetical protein